MKIHVKHVIWSVLVLATTAWSSFGEQFRCKNAGGCAASITTGGRTRTVVFRKGDMIETDSGWVVNPELGWERT
jgi:hypothetical protein